MQKRNPAADILRCLALFFVISVHFFLNNGYYTQIVEGNKMFIMTVMRSLFIICVPLFVTLSGFLLRKKELSGKYFKRIVPIILTYVLASIFCMAYSVIFKHEELSVKQAIGKILNFSGAPYSWYIEMYIGLFLLIPFLNILYNHLPSKKWKIILIFIFLFLSSAPSVANVYNFTTVTWWGMPSRSFEFSKIVPAWWTQIYPITYYFIGCYFSEYGIKMKKSLNLIYIIAFTFFYGFYTFWRSYNAAFIWGTWCDYASLFSVILTVLVFAFVMNFNYDKFPQKLSFVFQKISGLCLGAYLLSYIFDSIFYPILAEKVPVVTDRLPYYFLIVPAVYVTSLLLSYLLSKIQLLIELISKKIGGVIKKSRDKENQLEK